VVAWDGRVDLLAPCVDAAAQRAGLGEAVAGEVSGGVHRARALMIDENGERRAIPAGQHLLHKILREQDGAVDSRRFEFLARTDVHHARAAFAQRGGQFGGGDLHAPILLLAGLEVIDHLVHRQVVIAGADLGQRLVRSEAARGAAADVIFAKKGALGSGRDFQEFAHGGFAGDGDGRLHGANIAAIRDFRNLKFQRAHFTLFASRAYPAVLMRLQTLREARWIFAVLAAITILLGCWRPAASLPGVALILFTLYFFRDPDRAPPEEAEAVVAPADGLVVEIAEMNETEVVNGLMRRVAIFLSIFDVHTNRAPIDAEVTYTRHFPGKFLDARNPQCSLENESQTWAFRSGGTTLVVRQITGAIARRIVAWSNVGDRVKKGERFGMIRFGSRTEVYVPLDSEITVKRGDRVKGGQTIVARLRKEAP
jgi:phosphatidylserine decarboxylase